MSASRTRVVRLVPTLDFGGVESRIALQAAHAGRERIDLHVVTFWKDGWAGARVREAGIPVHVLGENPSVRNPRATWALVRLLRELRPDVLHASIGEANLHGALAGALARVPRRLIEEVGMPARRRAGRLAFRQAANAVDLVVGVSKATCRYLVEVERLPAAKVHLLYNCGKPGFFDGVERSPRIDRPFRIFTAGRLVEVKNQAMLIDAFAALHRTHPETELVIAGEGELRETLEAHARHAGVADAVRILGFRRDIRELLDASDVFVLPSHTEGCSVALIEAMATGIPVLGSTADGIAEVVGDEHRAWLVPATDTAGWTAALAELVTAGAEALHARGAMGRNIANERFAPPVYLNALESLYRDPLPRGGTA